MVTELSDIDSCIKTVKNDLLIERDEIFKKNDEYEDNDKFSFSTDIDEEDYLIYYDLIKKSESKKKLNN